MLIHQTSNTSDHLMRPAVILRTALFCVMAILISLPLISCSGSTLVPRDAIVASQLDEPSTYSSIVVDSGTVYLGGATLQSNKKDPRATVWVNGDKTILCEEESDVVDMALYNGELHIIGTIMGVERNHPFYLLNGQMVILGKQGDTATEIAVTDDGVYISGMLHNPRDEEMPTPGYWKDGQWVGFDGHGGTSSIWVEGNHVWVGGYVADGRGKTVPGYWHNGAWNKLDVPESFFHSGVVNDLVVTDGEVIAVGEWQRRWILNAKGASLWQGGTYTRLTETDADKVVVYGGEIFILGTVNYEYKYVERWKSYLWQGMSVYYLDRHEAYDLLDIAISDNTVFLAGVTRGVKKNAGRYYIIDADLPPGEMGYDR